MKKTFESVPNISEGRDVSKIERAKEVLQKSGVQLLHIDSDFDANRTVFTYVGEREAIKNASKNLLKFAKKHINLFFHEGVHPRIGAVDVMPFIPLGESTMNEAVALSQEVAAFAGNDLGIPTYLYCESAKIQERYLLKHCRKGFFEGIEKRFGDVFWHPDYGKPEKLPCGIANIGARFFLIAYNISLDTRNVSVARAIAKSLRETNKNPLNPVVTAIGWYQKKRSICQVSTNLNDYRKFNIHQAFHFVSHKAEKMGVSVLGSEIVGLIPQAAFEISCKETGKSTSELIKYLGLGLHKPFGEEKFLNLPA